MEDIHRNAIRDKRFDDDVFLKFLSDFLELTVIAVGVGESWDRLNRDKRVEVLKLALKMSVDDGDIVENDNTRRWMDKQLMPWLNSMGVLDLTVSDKKEEEIIEE